MLGRTIARGGWSGAALILLATAVPAGASTEAAWKASIKRGRTACIAAANLLHPTVSAPVGFSDHTGYDVLLVRGTYRQTFMKGAKGTMPCLYHRRTHRAEATEAKGWSAR